jgi:hypothetical protein
MLKPCAKTKRVGANYGTGFLFAGFLFRDSCAALLHNLALCGS